MTSEMLQKKLIKIMDNAKNEHTVIGDISDDSLLGITNLIKEFAGDLMAELENVVNGKTTQLTNLLVASCLEDMAKTVRGFGSNTEAKMFEFAFNTFFDKQAITMSVPGRIEEE